MKESNKKVVVSLVIAIIAAIATISAAYLHSLGKKEELPSPKNISEDNVKTYQSKETHEQKSPIIHNGNGNVSINY